MLKYTIFQANQNAVLFLNIPAKETLPLLFIYRSLCARLFIGEKKQKMNALKAYKSHLYLRHK